jgi:hypothetical protein
MRSVGLVAGPRPFPWAGRRSTACRLVARDLDAGGSLMSPRSSDASKMSSKRLHPRLDSAGWMIHPIGDAVIRTGRRTWAGAGNSFPRPRLATASLGHTISNHLASVPFLPLYGTKVLAAHQTPAILSLARPEMQGCWHPGEAVGESTFASTINLIA